LVVGSFSVVQLTTSYQLAEFNSGNSVLDNWLKNNGVQAQQSNTAAVYLLLNGGTVVGYYEIAMSSIEQSKSTVRVSKGTGKHRIPMALIARLAIDLSIQGKGYGAILLKDAVLRAILASVSVACHGILVHAIDDSAVAFYSRFGFEISPIAPRTLMVLLKDFK
jgi:GNAT superfamily N-acetyltransferase